MIDQNEDLKSSEQETVEPSKNEDPRLAKVRYYRSTWKTFFDYWKERGVKKDPYQGLEYQQPVKKMKEDEYPIQDFGTYSKSKMNRLIESFEEFMKL